MKTSIEWMEMAYEAEFSVPLFDLPGRNTELLKSLHRFIPPPIRGANHRHARVRWKRTIRRLRTPDHVRREWNDSR